MRLLNAYITSLIQLRDEIEDQDKKALSERLKSASGGRVRWFDERLAADWVNRDAKEVDIPSVTERLNQIFFGSLVSNRKPRK